MEKPEFNAKFGQFVKLKRGEKSLTQQQLADLVGNNYQNISRLERGEYGPTLFWVYNLAKSFDMTTVQLVEEFEKFLKKK